MELYLLRHAPAEERDPRRYPSDEERPLSRDGRARMASAARGLKALGLEFDRILTSPLIRARQTAEIVAAVLRDPPHAELFPPLSPGVEASSLARSLVSLRAGKRLLLVGHEPGLSLFAAFLLSGEGAGAALVLKKGGLCRIDFEGGIVPGEGRLIFHLPPRILRLLGGETA